MHVPDIVLCLFWKELSYIIIVCVVAEEEKKQYHVDVLVGHLQSTNFYAKRLMK